MVSIHYNNTSYKSVCFCGRMATVVALQSNCSCCCVFEKKFEKWRLWPAIAKNILHNSMMGAFIQCHTRKIVHLCLPTHCLTIPKLTYILRTSCCFYYGNELFDIDMDMDNDIKSTLKKLVNSRLNSEQWNNGHYCAFRRPWATKISDHQSFDQMVDEPIELCWFHATMEKCFHGMPRYETL